MKTIPLPLKKDAIGLSALEAISKDTFNINGQGILDLSVIARLLHYSAGITKTVRYPGGETRFRAAACTGALYHIELYVICGDLPGLSAGIYHYDPEESSLAVLRRGVGTSIAWSPDGSKLAWGSSSGAIVIWGIPYE